MGHASEWILRNTNASLVDVDTWEGSDEEVHQEFDWDDVYRTYQERILAWDDDRVSAYRITSDGYFGLLGREDLFDFVYVDGDHRAPQVMRDSLNAWERLKVGGVLAWDDYTWSSGRGPWYDPRPAIDGFWHLVQPYVEVLHVGTQLWVRKVTEP